MSFELMKKRTKQIGLNEDRLVAGKEYSFKVALERAYNAETAIHKDETYRVIINNNKQKIDYDEKIVSASNDMGLHTGSTIYVPRTDTHWLVITEHLSEKAYFKGDIKKALYEISWRDENNIKYSHWASVRGPVETKIKSDPVKGIANDIPNNTLTIWIGQTQGTQALKRYSFLMVAGKVWKVTVVDDVSQPGLVELQLIEAIANPAYDSLESNIARDKKILLTTIFDSVVEFKTNESISVNPNLHINGKLETAKHSDSLSITCSSELCSIGEDTVEFTTPGNYQITIGYKDLDIFKTYSITIVDSKTKDDISYIIEGNTKVRPMTSTLEDYTLEYYNNGVKGEIPVSGEWSIDPLYASILKQDSERVTLKFTSIVGKTELKYIYNNEVLATQPINIVSVFG